MSLPFAAPCQPCCRSRFCLHYPPRVARCFESSCECLRRADTWKDLGAKQLQNVVRTGRLTLERLIIRHVIDEEDAHSTAIVRSGDGAEPLLTGGIPDLQLDALAIKFDRLDLEINAVTGIIESRRVFMRMSGDKTSYPIVVMKLVVNESSENRNSKQLLPTPEQREHSNLRYSMTKQRVLPAVDTYRYHQSAVA